MNDTVSAFQALSTGSSWGGTVIYFGFFIFIPIAVFLIAASALYSLASYTKFKKYLDKLGYSFIYMMIGSVTCAVLALPMAVIYWGYKQAQTGNTVPLRYAGYIAGGYIVLSTIGYFVQKYVIDRVQKFEKELKPKRGKKKDGKDEQKSIRN